MRRSNRHTVSSDAQIDKSYCWIVLLSKFCICKTAFCLPISHIYIYIFNCTVLDSLSCAFATKVCLQAQHVTYREDRWRRTSEGNPVHFTIYVMSRCECPKSLEPSLVPQFSSVEFEPLGKIPYASCRIALPGAATEKGGARRDGARAAEIMQLSASRPVPISRSLLRVVMVVIGSATDSKLMSEWFDFQSI